MAVSAAPLLALPADRFLGAGDKMVSVNDHPADFAVGDNSIGTIMGLAP